MIFFTAPRKKFASFSYSDLLIAFCNEFEPLDQDFHKPIFADKIEFNYSEMRSIYMVQEEMKRKYELVRPQILICLDATRQQYVELCLVTLLKIAFSNC